MAPSALGLHVAILLWHMRFALGLELAAIYRPVKHFARLFGFHQKWNRLHVWFSLDAAADLWYGTGSRIPSNYFNKY